VSNLSPAAQAVLDAANNELDHAPWDVSYLAKPAVAAALRAAVAYTQQYQGNDCFSDEVWTCDADALLAIVNELEAHG
jgi:hypothetical protein